MKIKYPFQSTIPHQPYTQNELIFLYITHSENVIDYFHKSFELNAKFFSFSFFHHRRHRFLPPNTQHTIEGATGQRMNEENTTVKHQLKAKFMCRHCGKISMTCTSHMYCLLFHSLG